MRKTTIICINLFMILSLAGCGNSISVTDNSENTSELSNELNGDCIDLPFEISDIENIEVFHYIVPNNLQKKIITKNEDINRIYTVFKSLNLEDKETETAIGSVNLQFRFNLKDDSQFEASYCSAGSFARIRTTSQNKDYLTSADLDFCWFDDKLNYEIVDSSEEELAVTSKNKSIVVALSDEADAQ